MADTRKNPYPADSSMVMGNPDHAFGSDTLEIGGDLRLYTVLSTDEAQALLDVIADMDFSDYSINPETMKARLQRTADGQGPPEPGAQDFYA